MNLQHLLFTKMKSFLLLLCVYQVLASPSKELSLLDDLDKLLQSSDSNHRREKLQPVDKNDEWLSSQARAMLKAFDDEMNDKREEEPQYGYCIDGKTSALGPDEKDCALRLCYDKHPETCAEMLKMSSHDRKRECLKDLETFKRYRQKCPMTCGFCQPPSPQKSCEKQYGSKAPHGCCFDGLIALRQDKRDCPMCMDTYPHTCKQFMEKYNGVPCKTNKFRIRSFLQTRCPQMCGLCFRKPL